MVGLGIDPADADRAAPAVGAEIAADAMPIEDLVGRFESLGGTGQGCEFGLYQRCYGAEPLGLLRWAFMHPHELLAALDAEFEGVGTPEQTVLETPEHGVHLEYGALDRRFEMHMHTFVRADQVPADKMFAQLCRRLTFLRNKLLDDLREGGKIFVYKTIDPITDDEIRQLHRAVRRYGDSTLLYVGLQTPAKSFPLVEVKEPGLLAGYIDRFNTATDGSQVGLPVTSGDAIARNAFRLWQGQRAAASEAGLSQGDAVVQVERDAGEPHVVGQIAAEAGDDVGHWVHTAFQARQDGRVADARALLTAARCVFPIPLMFGTT